MSPRNLSAPHAASPVAASEPAISLSGELPSGARVGVDARFPLPTYPLPREINYTNPSSWEFPQVLPIIPSVPLTAPAVGIPVLGRQRRSKGTTTEPSCVYGILHLPPRSGKTIWRTPHLFGRRSHSKSRFAIGAIIDCASRSHRSVSPPWCRPHTVRTQHNTGAGSVWRSA